MHCTETTRIFGAVVHFRKLSSKSFLFIKDFFYGGKYGVISLLIPSGWEGDGAVGEMIFAQKMGLKTFSRWKAGKS
jgi:hypothetical protein